jgi:hypothetical protein
MKILYVTHGGYMDYQDDCLFIGLREILGEDIVDVNPRKHCYLSYPKEEIGNLYGKGMTVTRILEDLSIDRSEIEQKIQKKYFDYIVYGHALRYSQYLETCLNAMPRSKIAIVDGADEQGIHPLLYSLGTPYFKRELTITANRIYPISFGIPSQKLSPNLFQKKREFAICDPRDPTTYIYENEMDYYDGYKESYMAITKKKSGWDCMRHYEILANGCLPYFLDVDECPNQTMENYPKNICKEINIDLSKRVPVKEIYEKYIMKTYEHFKEKNTCEAEAKRFLARMDQLN